MLNRNSYYRSRLARAALITALVAAGTSVVYAQMEEDSAAPPIPPYALFQYSTLTGSGNTITATRLPVVTAAGTVYKNITLQFNIGPAGNLALAEGYPKVIPSPNHLAYAFRGGRYVGPTTVLDGQAIINVNGPGVTRGGATEWSILTAKGANGNTYPSSATWYVGPIASNPWAKRLKAAGITSQAWSYGIASSACGCPEWQANTLMGISQTGNTLTIVSFTSNGDHSEPVDEITYRLAP